jgi:mitotic spindle assembly checkpoint protein MAD2
MLGKEMIYGKHHWESELTGSKVSADDQVKAYIKKMMSQLNKWTLGGKISKLVVVITSKDTGENLERWQFDVQLMGKATKNKGSADAAGEENPSLRYARTPTSISVSSIRVRKQC